MTGPPLVAGAPLPATAEGGETGDSAAQRMAHALIGERALAEEVARWQGALLAHDARLITPLERRLWDLMVGAPWLITTLDAGLALGDPHGAVRHRLYLMLAVLEASPAHTRHFLPREFAAVGMTLLVWRGGLAGIRSVLGFALVRVLAFAWR